VSAISARAFAPLSHLTTAQPGGGAVAVDLEETAASLGTATGARVSQAQGP